MAWKNVQYEDGKMRTSEGGGGGGSSTFAGLDDVSFNNIQNGQVPKYNSTTQKWENADESGGGGTVTDVTVDGTSVVNQQGVAEIPAIPDGLHHYSTTEHVVGTWIDGKPLYEKTVDMGSFSTGYGQYPHNIAGIDYIISYRFIGKRSDGNGGWFDNNSVGNDILLTVNKTDVYRQSNSITCEKAYLTIQYTKTTD